MAMISIRDGTTVFVPWRIQGIVRNEDRLRNYSLHVLEKQNKYLLNCITREQMLASNRLDRFMEKLNNAPRSSEIIARQNKGVMNRIQSKKVQGKTMTWRKKKRLQPKESTAVPAKPHQSSNTRFLPEISTPKQTATLDVPKPSRNLYHLPKAQV